MIKTPVGRSNDADSQFIYSQDIFDADGSHICEAIDDEMTDKLIEIINSHQDLYSSLKDMVEIVGSNFCQNMEIKRKYKIARELLECCK